MSLLFCQFSGEPLIEEEEVSEQPKINDQPEYPVARYLLSSGTHYCEEDNHPQVD